MHDPPALQPKFFEGNPGEKGEPWLNNLFRMLDSVYGQKREQVTASFMFYLTGPAEAWYYSLSEEKKQNPAAVLEAFKQRFDGKDVYPVHQISQASNETVSDFTTRFLEMTNNRNLPDFWLKASFIDGLKPILKKIVKPQAISDFEDARRAALRAELVESDCAEVSAMSSPLDSQIQTLTTQLQNLAHHVKELGQQQSTITTPDQPQQPLTYQRRKHQQQRKPKLTDQQPQPKNQGRNNSFYPHSLCILCRVAHNNDADCPYYEKREDIIAEFGPQRNR